MLPATGAAIPWIRVEVGARERGTTIAALYATPISAVLVVFNAPTSFSLGHRRRRRTFEDVTHPRLARQDGTTD